VEGDPRAPAVRCHAFARANFLHRQLLFGAFIVEHSNSVLFVSLEWSPWGYSTSFCGGLAKICRRQCTANDSILTLMPMPLSRRLLSRRPSINQHICCPGTVSLGTVAAFAVSMFAILAFAVPASWHKIARPFYGMTRIRMCGCEIVKKWMLLLMSKSRSFALTRYTNCS